jgi:hypothetical protein
MEKVKSVALLAFLSLGLLSVALPALTKVAFTDDPDPWPGDPPASLQVP